MSMIEKQLISTDQATRELAARIVSVLDLREEVLEAYLFGSRATGRAQPHSDIDVAVYIQERDAAHRGVRLRGRAHH